MFAAVFLLFLFFCRTDAKSVESVQGRVQDIFCKEPALLEVADRAFKAYLKGIAYLKDRTVFDVTSIDRELFAKWVRFRMLYFWLVYIEER